MGELTHFVGCVKSTETRLLTKSLAFTEAPRSHRSFTLEEQSAMTVEERKSTT